ncbi:DNA-directed RNA polymerase I subunit RPA43 [Protopterus annectens]|uniref:DNA-directed RNA polymerase I subunit RPA43 n=1 Tax=Protopterus annectens TaxID=7888 RepID=UPI001CF9B35C|nr:DNA-directed RNA polymerase I subunit RPA43 [Protopterus annectens]
MAVSSMETSLQKVVVNNNTQLSSSALNGEVCVPTPITSLIPSFADACSLLKSRYSCLVVDKRRRHIALSPMYLKKKKSGIEEQLNAELLRYSERLKGVPLAYENIRIIGELGDILDDQGYVHLNIEADFIIFCPKKGKKLVGVINKVAPSHIGCLVHGCFNASIPKPYNVTPAAWQGMGFKVGDQLEFEVFNMDADAAGVFCIRGRLNTDRTDVHTLNVEEQSIDVNCNVEVQLDTRQQQTKSDTEVSSLEAIEAVDTSKLDAEASDRDSITKQMGKASKKKKKKRRHLEASSLVEIHGMAIDAEQVDKSRKKKKKQSIPEADSLVKIHETDFAEYHNEQKVSKKKKRKHSDVEYHNEQKVSKKKKRKHSDVETECDDLTLEPRIKKKKQAENS